MQMYQTLVFTEHSSIGYTDHLVNYTCVLRGLIDNMCAACKGLIYGGIWLCDTAFLTLFPFKDIPALPLQLKTKKCRNH